MQVFEERGKSEYPGKKLSEQTREPTNSTYIWRRVWESNPGHIGGRRVLSPLLSTNIVMQGSIFAEATIFSHTQEWLFSSTWLRGSHTLLHVKNTFTCLCEAPYRQETLFNKKRECNHKRLTVHLGLEHLGISPFIIVLCVMKSKFTISTLFSSPFFFL